MSDIKHSNLLWLDLETTGLDPRKDQILQVGVIVTDDDLNEKARGEWTLGIKYIPIVAGPVFEMHTKSGLFSRALESDDTTEYVDGCLANWIVKNCPGPRYLAGSSIHFDRSFIKEHFPQTENLLHYRMLDVTSLRIVEQIKGLEVEKVEPAHTALADIQETIKEYKRLRGIK